jgi:cytochrome c-type biogenesis protein CcmE
MNKKLKKKIWISLGALVVVGAAVTASLVTLKSCNNNKNINLSYEISNPTNPNEKNVLKYGSELTITITQKNVLGDIV